MFKKVNSKVNILITTDKDVEQQLKSNLSSLKLSAKVVSCAGSLAAQLKQQSFDFIFVSADATKIDSALLHKCDLAGARTILIASNPAQHSYALGLGVADILQYPFDPDAFARIFGILKQNSREKMGKSSISKSQSAPPAPKAKGKIVCVWGPHGSPGVSTIASSLAFALKNMNKSTVLIDADTYGGSLSSMLGISDESSSFLAASRLADEGKLDEEALAKLFSYSANNTLCVLSGIGNPFRWSEFSREGVRGVLEACQSLADYVVVDIGFCLEIFDYYAFDCDIPQRNMPTTACLEMADMCVSVCDASAVGVARFLRHRPQLLDLVGEGCRVITVVNKIRLRGYAEQDPAAFYNLLKRFAHIDRVYDCCFDPRTCMRALAASVPVVSAAPKSRLAGQMHNLALDLCKE